MSELSKPADERNELREQIIGLGERSLRKSYYPQLQQQLEALKAAKESLERKAVELDAMRLRAEESEAYARELFDKSSEAILVHDPYSFRINEVNEAFSELFGYTREEISRLSVPQISSPRSEFQHGSLASLMDRVLAEGCARTEWLSLRKDGSEFWVEVSLKRAKLRGMTQIMACVRDITERRRAEAAVAEANRVLEEKVAHRTRDLARANEELAKLLGHLQSAQKQLVQSEKLASLGSLVAGIAHELNTPIGNGLMVASTMQDHREKFVAELTVGLRKSVLNEFLDNLEAGCDSLLRNLLRASELISSFKDMAVDQESSRRRRFDLVEVIRDIEIAQGPTLRKAGCRLVSRIAPGIELDSFPGPLGQVIGNLIANSIIHGFEGISGGEITLDAERRGDRVLLIFSDNGRGIAEDLLPRIFDPFFTTRLGQGGSGLGLHIVYTIVVGVLGGSIDVKSAPGQGVEFRILLPLVAPEHPAG